MNVISLAYEKKFFLVLLTKILQEEKPFLYLQFLTENLAYFPYETHEETNFVCYCITNILSKLLKELTFDFQFCLETKEELSDEEVELEHVEGFYCLSAYIEKSAVQFLFLLFIFFFRFSKNPRRVLLYWGLH
jgi:hypothetical protein